MITFGNFELVPLRSLLLPGDIRKRVATDLAKRKCDAMKAMGGQLHPFIVRASTNRVISDYDDVAACFLSLTEHVWCQFVEGSDSEMEMLRMADIAFRIHSQEAQNFALSRFYELSEQAADIPGKPGPKLRKLSRRLKEANGIDPAVAKREASAIKKQLNRMLEGPLETLGTFPTKGFETQVEDVQDLIADTLKQLLQVQINLKHLSKMNFPRVLLEGIGELCANLKKQIATANPRSVCPWCKLHPEVIKECAACEGCGWVGKAQMMLAPPELLDTTTPVISYHGQYMKFEPAILPPEEPTETELQELFP
jgi:hypothetical protein